MDIPTLPPAAPPGQPALFRAAQELETTFLAEMLRAAGLGESGGSFGGSFGGGAGEAHFRSFLVDEQARGLVEAGGIGLTESLFAALARQGHDG